MWYINRLYNSVLPAFLDSKCILVHIRIFSYRLIDTSSCLVLFLLDTVLSLYMRIYYQQYGNVNISFLVSRTEMDPWHHYSVILCYPWQVPRWWQQRQSPCRSKGSMPVRPTAKRRTLCPVGAPRWARPTSLCSDSTWMESTQSLTPPCCLLLPPSFSRLAVTQDAVH